MAETNLHRLFNTDINAMQNHNNVIALLLQVLVQNYIEQEYKTKDVYVYSETINDIDVFTKDLQTIDAIKDGIRANIKIKTFLDILPDNCYTNSYEVKTGKLSYVLQFKNLLQLLTKTKYQPNTKLELILIPSRCNVNMDELKEQYKLFDKLKKEILTKPMDTQRKIFNTFINKTFLFNTNILDAIIHVLGMEANGKLKETYETLRGLTKRRDRISANMRLIIADLKLLDYNKEDIRELNRLQKKFNKTLSKLKEEELYNNLDVINNILNELNALLTDIKLTMFSKYDGVGLDDIVNDINNACKNISREIENNKDISYEQFTILHDNLINTSIEILSLEDLTKYDISTSYILNIINALM